MAENRRSNIVDILKKDPKPVKGSDLATKLGVSRQVIVQDVALLRAQGEQIIATPQGYFLAQSFDSQKEKRIFPCSHNDYQEMKKELSIVINKGGKVLDVCVEHPLYGEIKGNLMLESMDDVENFISKFLKLEAEPLSVLTKGVHLHTVEAKSQEILDKIELELKKEGFLL